MKIGIVTLHRSPSYGACLQAYATQEVLNSLGFESEMIDYTNSYDQEKNKVFYSSDGSFISGLKHGIKGIFFGRVHSMKKAFGQFEKNYSSSSRRYTNVQDMCDLSYDAMVIGSDQVWNPEILGHLDPAYLLQFGHTKCKISVASSIGSHVLSEANQEQMRDALADFRAISVRENFAADQIRRLGFNNVKVICDPTLMISIEKWKSFIKPYPTNIGKKPYILTFFVSANFPHFKDRVTKIADGKEAEIWNVQTSNFSWPGMDRCIAGATPEQFLHLIEQANCVITDSFHGTAFSLMFNKELYVLESTGNPMRTRELLTKVGMLTGSKGEATDTVFVPQQAYSSINPILADIRDDAIAWIKESLTE